MRQPVQIYMADSTRGIHFYGAMSGRSPATLCVSHRPVFFSLCLARSGSGRIGGFADCGTALDDGQGHGRCAPSGEVDGVLAASEGTVEEQGRVAVCHGDDGEGEVVSVVGARHGACRGQEGVGDGPGGLVDLRVTALVQAGAEQCLE
jgi:hypothetical protein